MSCSFEEMESLSSRATKFYNKNYIDNDMREIKCHTDTLMSAITFKKSATII